MTGALLIDVDSTIPNLALMHISTWRKSLGIPTYRYGAPDAPDWASDPSEVWASCIFTKNAHRTDGLRWIYPNAALDIGGTGISTSLSLPPEVDSVCPDYSIYPECDYDLGFTTRGCIRNCPFCFVPRKEGKFRIHQHPEEFHDPSHKWVKLLDNNILADKDWFFEVTDWILANNLGVEFNQGLDVRLLDSEICARIKQLRLVHTLHFAFDHINYRDDVERGITMLESAGINLRQIGFYVYVGSDSQFDDALERCNILRSHNTTAYVMLDPEKGITQRLRDLKRWSNPIIFFKTPFDGYDRNIRTGCTPRPRTSRLSEHL